MGKISFKFMNPRIQRGGIEFTILLTISTFSWRRIEELSGVVLVTNAARNWSSSLYHLWSSWTRDKYQSSTSWATTSRWACLRSSSSHICNACLSCYCNILAVFIVVEVGMGVWVRSGVGGKGMRRKRKGNKLRHLVEGQASSHRIVGFPHARSTWSYAAQG